MENLLLLGVPILKHIMVCHIHVITVFVLSLMADLRDQNCSYEVLANIFFLNAGKCNHLISVQYRLIMHMQMKKSLTEL